MRPVSAMSVLGVFLMTRACVATANKTAEIGSRSVMTRLRRASLIGLVLLVLLVGLPSVKAADLNVGVVDIETILSELPERAALEEKLGKEFAALRAEVDTKWNEVAQLSKELEGSKKALSAKGQSELQGQLIEKETSLSEYWNQTAESIRARTEALSGELSERVEGALVRYAKGEGYDLLFDKKSGKLIYALEAFDCTDAAMRAVLGTTGNSTATPEPE